MKILLPILYMFVGVAPCAFAASGELVKFSKTSSISSNGSLMSAGNCRPRNYSGTGDEYLYVGNTSGSGTGYEADNGDCAQPTQVCIAGPSVSDADTGYNSCWQSTDTGMTFLGEFGTDNEWHKTETIPDCPVDNKSKWTKNSSDPRKVPVFVTIDNTVLTTASPIYVLKTIVGTNVKQTMHIQCIAYVCKNSDNTFSYGCPDGSCADPCPNSDTSEGGKDDGSGSNSTSNDKNKHRNSVQPYLDVLNNCKI